MSKYTTEVRYICESLYDGVSHGFSDVEDIIEQTAPRIFDFAFPIFDENYRLTLECKILRHYYTREISEETYGLWKLRLADKLNLIMPYYNKLYKSELLNFNPFIDVDIKTAHNRDAEHDSNRESGRQQKYEDGIVATEYGTDKDNRDIQSSTEQTSTGTVDNDNEKKSNKTDKMVSHGQRSNVDRTTEGGTDDKNAREFVVGNTTLEKTTDEERNKNATTSTQKTGVDNVAENLEKGSKSQEISSSDENRTTTDVKGEQTLSSASNQEDSVQTDATKSTEIADNEMSNTEKTEQRDDNYSHLTTADTLNHTNDNWNLYSDTPQGTLENMGGGWMTTGENAGDAVDGTVQYLTNATRVHDTLDQTDNKDHTTNGNESRVADRQVDQNETNEKEAEQEKESVISKTDVREDEVNKEGREYRGEAATKQNTSAGETAENEGRIKSGSYDENNSGVEIGEEKTSGTGFEIGAQDSDKVESSESNYYKTGETSSDGDSREQKTDKSGYYETESGYQHSNDKTNVKNEEKSTGNSSFDRYRGEEKSGATSDRTKDVSRITTTEEYTENIFGKRGGITYSKMLTEFRETFLNIDLMIINELRPLFFGLW